jgi:hypothetical protein
MDLLMPALSAYLRRPVRMLLLWNVLWRQLLLLLLLVVLPALLWCRHGPLLLVVPLQLLLLLLCELRVTCCIGSRWWPGCAVHILLLLLQWRPRALHLTRCHGVLMEERLLWIEHG